MHSWYYYIHTYACMLYLWVDKRLLVIIALVANRQPNGCAECMWSVFTVFWNGRIWKLNAKYEEISQGIDPPAGPWTFYCAEFAPPCWGWPATSVPPTTPWGLTRLPMGMTVAQKPSACAADWGRAKAPFLTSWLALGHSWSLAPLQCSRIDVLESSIYTPPAWRYSQCCSRLFDSAVFYLLPSSW